MCSGRCEWAVVSMPHIGRFLLVTYLVTAMDLRNWPRLKAKKARPMAATARNCGQTVSIPAPRKMMACEKRDEVARGQEQREPLHPRRLALDRRVTAREQLAAR